MALVSTTVASSCFLRLRARPGTRRRRVIRFSAALVVVAIGVLIAGVATSSLLLVYVAIGMSAVALLVLAAGVALKRDELFRDDGRPASAVDGVTAGQQAVARHQPASSGGWQRGQRQPGPGPRRRGGFRLGVLPGRQRPGRHRPGRQRPERQRLGEPGIARCQARPAGQRRPGRREACGVTTCLGIQPARRGPPNGRPAREHAAADCGPVAWRGLGGVRLPRGACGRGGHAAARRAQRDPAASRSADEGGSRAPRGLTCCRPG